MKRQVRVAGYRLTCSARRGRPGRPGPCSRDKAGRGLIGRNPAFWVCWPLCSADGVGLVEGTAHRPTVAARLRPMGRTRIVWTPPAALAGRPAPPWGAARGRSGARGAGIGCCRHVLRWRFPVQSAIPRPPGRTDPAAWARDIGAGRRGRCGHREPCARVVRLGAGGDCCQSGSAR
jgi:hypothetical protein